MRLLPKIVLLFLVLVLVLSACTPTDEVYLPALLEDPMASYEGDGIELIERSTQGYGTTFFMDKTQPAEVTSVYRISVGSDADKALAEAVEVASSSGWEMTAAPLEDTRYTGSKAFGVGEGLLLIVVAPDQGGQGDNLHMSLGFSSINSVIDTTASTSEGT